VIIGNSSIDFKAVRVRMEDGSYDSMIEIDQDGRKTLVPVSHVEKLIVEAQYATLQAGQGLGELREN
jgi:hypothetical protein